MINLTLQNLPEQAAIPKDTTESMFLAIFISVLIFIVVMYYLYKNYDLKKQKNKLLLEYALEMKSITKEDYNPLSVKEFKDVLN